MNLGQLIGEYQMRLAELEAPSAKRTKAWLQAEVLELIDRCGRAVSNVEIQEALSISGAEATVTLWNMTNAKKLVRTGARRHYRYERAPT